MNAKEAIEIMQGVEELRGTLPEDGLLVEEALDMAIEALKKHIPKEPIWEGSGYVYGEMVYDTWRCPSCDTLYEEDEKYHYCPRCGQKILWKED